MDRGKEGSLQHNIYEYSGFGWMAFSHKGVWLAQITRDVHVLPADRSLLLYAARDSYPLACAILVCYYGALCRYLIWFFVFANYRFGWSGDISTALLIIVFFYGPVSFQLPNPPIVLHFQESLKELKKQVSQHPSIVPADFDITREGKLVLHVSPEFAVACEAATLPLNSSIMVQVRSLFPSGLGSRVCVVAVMGN